MRTTVLVALLLALFAPFAEADGPRRGSDDSGCCRPRSKGFWHRQCLGIGELSPGRGGGNGPGMHPAFSESELRDILRRADRRIGGRCEGACDALDEENHRTAQGRAMAQYAALVLNFEAGYLRGCDADGSLLRRVDRLLDERRWEEAKDLAESANLGRSVRRCDGDRDDDDPSRPGCGRHGHDRDCRCDRDRHDDRDDDDDDRGPRPSCGHDGHDRDCRCDRDGRDHDEKDKGKDKDKDKDKGGKSKGKGKG